MSKYVKRLEIIARFKALAKEYRRTENQTMWEQTARNLREICTESEYKRLPNYAKI